LNEIALANIDDISKTLDTFHPDIVVKPELLKELLDKNIPFIVVAADVFQLPIFWLKGEDANICVKLVTFEVFHVPIG